VKRTAKKRWLAGTVKLLFALLLALSTLVAQCGGSQDVNVTPIIYLYAPGDRTFAGMLASLIGNDTRIRQSGAKVELLDTQSEVIWATALPNTACLVIYSDNARQLEGLETPLLAFFKNGGGLLGIREICFKHRGLERLVSVVFPTFANGSIKQTGTAKRRVRTYVAVEPGEIGEELPDRFDLVSMGTYYCADQDGNYLRIPSNYQVAYMDEEIGAPLVVVAESDRGGRSVGMPGIWVVKASRVDIYYGNLVSDENFVRLFTNSVVWAMESSWFRDKGLNMHRRMAQMIEKEETLAKDLERIERTKKGRRTIVLAVLWVIGLAACAVIARNTILVPLEEE